ncbi:MAG: hypothetical protein V1494_06645 [Candidatus Diapherotrites archaeon]
MLSEEKAQISVELIIVLAAVVAVVLVLVGQMNKTVQNGVGKFSKSSDDVFAQIDKMAKID